MPISTKSSSGRRSSLLLVFAVFCIILLNNSRSKSHTRSHRSPRIAVLTEGYPAPGNDSFELQITGYWKEVRASLGLSSLHGSILLPNGSDLTTNGTNARESDLDGGLDERSLLRLGRLNPGLRRRRIDSDPGLPSSAYQSRYGDAYSKSKDSDLIREPRSERSRDLGFVVESDTSEIRGPSSAARVPSEHLDLFISNESPSAPRTPVGDLAASFRAIAVKELKARRGSRRLKRRELFR